MEYKALKDIARITMGQSPDSSSYNEDGDGMPFFQGNADFGEVYPNERIWCNDPKKIAEPGDILISVRAPIGALNYAKDECCIGRGLAAITIEDEAERNYVFHLLKAKNSDLNKQGTGSTFKAIGKAVLEDVQVPQISREEQQNYMKMMDLLESIIRKRKTQLASLDELIKARFVEMFGTPLLNQKGWGVITAEECCNVITDGSHFSPQGQVEGYPMLSVKDMRNDGFHYESCKRVSEDDFQILKKQGCIPQVNDVLISKDGSYFYYGFVLSEYKDQAILSSIAMLRPDTQVVNPYYLCNYMLSERIVELVSENYVTGAALKRVILKGIKHIPVMVPPIESQNEFADFVKQVDKSKLLHFDNVA